MSIQNDLEGEPSLSSTLSTVGLVLLTLMGLLALWLIVITPLPTGKQALFGVLTIVAVFAFTRARSRFSKFLFAAGAAITSSRYIYWRLTETLGFETAFEAMLGYGVLLAEFYLWLVLILSFFQSLWARNRQPAPLPEDLSQWPTVDVYIPTYNEPTSIVRTTVLAAKAMNYPADKLRVFVLDDGRREAMREMAEEMGVDYIIRPDNNHAKAGNLNHAMKLTDGELIAIFDCDHVPTHGFLQHTVGWFLKDRHMAMLQTPHYFYNKDPFEKNLKSGRRLPNEGLLFYGLVQDGNDFWNASFFCGSCAVLRRSALEEVGGIAVETVTEDAHTSLKMQRRGWNTGFLRLPLSAGLATETLADHIGQRMRWARGMIQIFRLDNPFLGKGLSLAQRICYCNAMLHFMFPIPRVILLLAPLAFLVLGQHIIVADPWEILAYAGPHLIVATMASLRIQGRFRHPFWAEIYESALAFHLVWPTLMTFLQPHKGKFNVTSKGGQKEMTYFDWSVLRLQIGVVIALACSAAIGVATVLIFELGPGVGATTLINVVWAVISIIFLLAAIAVGVEARELRAEPRIAAKLPATIYLPDGHALSVQSEDISVGGARFHLPRPQAFDEEVVDIELRDGTFNAVTPARVIEWSDGVARFEFTPESARAREDIVRVVLGRTDSWRGWDNWPEGTVSKAVSEIFEAVGGFLSFAWKLIGQKSRLRRAATGVALLGALLAGVVLSAESAQAADGLGRASLDETLGRILGDKGAQGYAPADAKRSPAVSPQSHIGRSLEFTLKDFGVLQPIRLQGRSNTRGIGFSIRSDEVVSSARIRVRVAYSPNLDPANSQLSVSLNGEIVHSAILDPVIGTSQIIEFDANPYLFLPDNELVFSLSARRADSATQCTGADDGMVWAQISNATEINLEVARLELATDLNQLPLPFFDRRDATELSLPMVFASSPSLPTVTAASAVASYWGALASYRGASFPVRIGNLPEGHAIVFALAGQTVPGLRLPEIKGPTLAILENPNSAYGRLLLVGGRNAAELDAAARTLSLGPTFLTGSSTQVSAPMAQSREAYDAPRWIKTDRPVSFGELAEPAELEGRGLDPGILSVNFLTAPDLFVWGDKGIPVKVKFRTPGAEWIDPEKSRLDVLINDKYIQSLPVAQTGSSDLVPDLTRADFVQSEGEVVIPPYLVNGQNQLQFYFDLKPVNDDPCAPLPDDLRTAIDLESTIDFSGDGAVHQDAEFGLFRASRLALHAQGGPSGNGHRSAEPVRQI